MAFSELRRELAYSWYEPKPFWYLYFSGVLNFVTGIFLLQEVQNRTGIGKDKYEEWKKVVK